MPEFESIRISGNCGWLDWHGHWLTRLEHSPITERPHHVTDSTFFLEVKISFDVTFDFVEPPLQVSDSLIVRHISHIISRLRLLGVKVESISESLLGRDLVELHICLRRNSIELRILSMHKNRDLVLGTLKLLTAKKIWPLNFDDRPHLLIKNMILLKSFSFLLGFGLWWWLGNILRLRGELLLLIYLVPC